MAEVQNCTDATALRQQLKKWEKSFAAANGGRKPEREDIKNDASISAKYREYDVLRRRSSESQNVETPRKAKRTQPARGEERTALRERSNNTVSATPQKTKGAKTLEVIEEEQAPEPTPAFIRCALGPTPQKDGQVLGIFDMIPTATPSKTLPSSPTAPQLPALNNTPTKPTAPPSSEDHPLSRTPQSSSKRRYLEAFGGTPLKRNLDKNNEVPTPPSSSKRAFATPSFLRRSFPLAPIAEDDDADAHALQPPPLKKRGLVRSLSSIIQGLRKREEERMEDEWEILNELEAEERGQGAKPEVREVLVKDSQVAEMPLGPDQAPLEGEGDGVESEGEVVGGVDGRVRKPWKKKGLKRQTRRVIMRPVMRKPGKAGEGGVGEEGSDGEVQGMEALERRDGSDGEAEGSEGDGQGAQTAGRKAAADPKKRAAQDDGNVKSDEKSGSKKKISAQGHANFRKLKIKNKNSKANGRGGRFGRR